MVFSPSKRQDLGNKSVDIKEKPTKKDQVEAEIDANEGDQKEEQEDEKALSSAGICKRVRKKLHQVRN